MKVEIKSPGVELCLDMTSNSIGELIRIALNLAHGKEEAPAPETIPKIKGERRKEWKTFRGFVVTECGNCGRVKAFCTKKTLRYGSCGCGTRTLLKNPKVIEAVCKCGKAMTYVTNMTKPEHTLECIYCGSMVDVKFDEQAGEYLS